MQLVHNFERAHAPAALANFKLRVLSPAIGSINYPFAMLFHIELA